MAIPKIPPPLPGWSPGKVRLLRAQKGKQTQFDNSVTGVIPKRTHGFGIWNGERKVVNIRIDEKLYKATKPILIRYFGSVCAAIEPYLASIYSIATTNNWTQEGGVIPSITVDIGNLNIRRHMKARRKFVVEEETEVTYDHRIICSYCGEPATWEVYPSSSVAERVVYACDLHYQSMLDRRLVGDAKPVVYEGVVK